MNLFAVVGRYAVDCLFALFVRRWIWEKRQRKVRKFHYMRRLLQLGPAVKEGG